MCSHETDGNTRDSAWAVKVKIVGDARYQSLGSLQFAQYFPDSKIVSAVSTQLAWSHVIEILPLNDDLQREFYITLAASERWSVRRLRKEIDGMLFERTAISGKPEEFIKKMT